MPHGEYGDVHRTIVQTFMSKKVMPEKEALELVRSSARYCSCSFPLLSLSPPFHKEVCLQSRAQQLMNTTPLLATMHRKYPDCQVAEPRNPNELT